MIVTRTLLATVIACILPLSATAEPTCEEAVIDSAKVLMELVGFANLNGNGKAADAQTILESSAVPKNSVVPIMAELLVLVEDDEHLFQASNGTTAMFVGRKDSEGVAPSLFVMFPSSDEVLIDPQTIIGLSLVAERAVAQGQAHGLRDILLPKDQIVLSKSSVVYKAEDSLIRSQLSESGVDMVIIGSDGAEVATQNVKLKKDCMHFLAALSEK